MSGMSRLTDKSGEISKIEDPQGIPFRYSTKWVPDLAELLKDKSQFPEVWSKFSVLPIPQDVKNECMMNMMRIKR